MQMYLNSLMFINFSINIEDEYSCLLKTLKNYGVYNKNEKKIYNIKSENSLDKLSNFIRTFSPENSPNRKHKSTVIKKEKKKYLINKIFGIKLNFKFNKDINKKDKSNIISSSNNNITNFTNNSINKSTHITDKNNNKVLKKNYIFKKIYKPFIKI